MLLEQRARRLALHTARAGDHDGVINGHRIGDRFIKQTVCYNELMIRGEIAEYRTVKAVGKCIYCGSLENLHDEHCIPESLNGTHVLGKGSCGDCAKITSKFEGDYARESMLAVRTALNMKSKRSKSKRPTQFPMHLIKDGQEQVMNVPVSDHYSVIPMIDIGPSGKYPHRPHVLGLRHGQYKLHPFPIRPNEHVEYLAKKYGADEMSVDFHCANIPAFWRAINPWVKPGQR